MSKTSDSELLVRLGGKLIRLSLREDGELKSTVLNPDEVMEIAVFDGVESSTDTHLQSIVDEVMEKSTHDIKKSLYDAALQSLGFYKSGKSLSISHSGVITEILSEELKCVFASEIQAYLEKHMTQLIEKCTPHIQETFERQIQYFAESEIRHSARNTVQNIIAEAERRKTTQFREMGLAALWKKRTKTEKIDD